MSHTIKNCTVLTSAWGKATLPRRERVKMATIVTNNGSTHRGRLMPGPLLAGLVEVLRQNRHRGWTLTSSIDDSEFTVCAPDRVCPKCKREMQWHDHTPHPGDDGYPFLRLACDGSLYQLVDDVPMIEAGIPAAELFIGRPPSLDSLQALFGEAARDIDFRPVVCP